MARSNVQIVMSSNKEPTQCRMFVRNNSSSLLEEPLRWGRASAVWKISVQTPDVITCKSLQRVHDRWMRHKWWAKRDEKYFRPDSISWPLVSVLTHRTSTLHRPTRLSFRCTSSSSSTKGRKDIYSCCSLIIALHDKQRTLRFWLLQKSKLPVHMH